MKVAQPLNCAGSNQRRIARKHDDVVIVPKRFSRRHDRVPGAALFFLQYEPDAGGVHGIAHPIGFVPDNRVHVLGREDPSGGVDYVCQQRLAAYLMQHFGVPRFQPRSLARSKDGDSKPGSPGRVLRRLRHCGSIYRMGQAGLWITSTSLPEKVSTAERSPLSFPGRSYPNLSSCSGWPWL